MESAHDADKCHHGKEEDTLFRNLSQKKVSFEHKKAMEEFSEDHKMGGTVVAKLVDARNSYSQGKGARLASIKKQIKWLVEFYT